MMANALNAAAVAPFDPSMEGSGVLVARDGLIFEVPLNQTAASLLSDGPSLFKTMNLMRFSSIALSMTIVPALDELIGSGASKAYTEEVLAYLIEKRGLQLAAARCDDQRWYEIDSVGDLRVAERIFGTQTLG